jgi:hypothetical protein
MIDTPVRVLAGWESFYVIVGSSGAALIGLQFVVIVLIAEAHIKSSHETIGAFGTPTVVHFAAALLISAIMSAPWSTLGGVRIPLLLVAVYGLVIGVNAIRRARRQDGYKPVFEDWVFHTTLPVVAYAALFVAALVITAHATGALFAIAGLALLLLLIGIHNAWDTVTYIAVDQIAGRDEAE